VSSSDAGSGLKGLQRSQPSNPDVESGVVSGGGCLCVEEGAATGFLPGTALANGREIGDVWKSIEPMRSVASHA
jgi:hypothetical protein